MVMACVVMAYIVKASIVMAYDVHKREGPQIVARHPSLIREKERKKRSPWVVFGAYIVVA